MKDWLRLSCLSLALVLGGVVADTGWAQQQPPLPPVAPAQPAPEPEGRAQDLPTQTIEATPEQASQIASPVLTIDQERLYAGSSWGKRALAQLDEEGGKIATENERLANQLSDEEARLSDQRTTMDPTQFRELAEAFDRRATQVRRERAQAVQILNEWAEADRNAFYRAALPVMGDAMKARGAVAVLDRRTVFVSLDAIDITGDLILRLDEELGDGDGAVPLEPAPSTKGATDSTPPSAAPAGSAPDAEPAPPVD